MEHAEALLTIAQISLGLAGFGGVFVAMGGVRAAERRPADAYRLILLMSTALTTLVLSLLPVALQALGVPPGTLWPVSNGLQAALLAALLVVFQRLRRSHREEIRAGEAGPVAVGIYVLAVVTLGAELASAAGAFQSRAAGVFLLGLVFLVAFGSYLFARMLFLWRS
jgi:hypothetical protein